ncbi:MAG: hypothetical protein AAEI08_06665, partial [Gammaproteobacteria bacterium]
MSGYLGSSSRTRPKNGSRQPRDGNVKKRSSRRKKFVRDELRDELPDDEEFDVIPEAELELTKQ